MAGHDKTGGWADYQTPRDKALLGATTWAKAEPFGLGSRPAVLVIDMYYAALGYPRQPILDAVATWPSACGEEGWAAVDRTVGLLAAARAADVPVVYFHKAPPEFGRGSRKPLAKVAPRGTDKDGNAIVDELAPLPGDLVLRKVAPSGFHDNPLDTILRRRGVDTLIVCGESTSGCVRATVVDAHSRGYRVGVVQECCFDRFESSHWMSLFDMGQKYSDLMSLDASVTYLESVRKG